MRSCRFFFSFYLLVHLSLHGVTIYITLYPDSNRTILAHLLAPALSLSLSPPSLSRAQSLLLSQTGNESVFIYRNCETNNEAIARCTVDVSTFPLCLFTLRRVVTHACTCVHYVILRREYQHSYMHSYYMWPYTTVLSSLYSHRLYRYHASH